ncbi:hypothetical protein CEXT_172371 [Caerostris extrusa]|uniref:Uncharacterized protein n=1 Tax=Caerostris extrusa TaxID=172846 RepID=A0AAV4XG81_CAEEX|nr:hypothetical protein CEXT_172371 [Caerostris extrusa]
MEKALQCVSDEKAFENKVCFFFSFSSTVKGSSTRTEKAQNLRDGLASLALVATSIDEMFMYNGSGNLRAGEGAFFFNAFSGNAEGLLNLHLYVSIMSVGNGF